MNRAFVEYGLYGLATDFSCDLDDEAGQGRDNSLDNDIDTDDMRDPNCQGGSYLRLLRYY